MSYVVALLSKKKGKIKKMENENKIALIQHLLVDEEDFNKEDLRTIINTNCNQYLRNELVRQVKDKLNDDTEEIEITLKISKCHDV